MTGARVATDQLTLSTGLRGSSVNFGLALPYSPEFEPGLISNTGIWLPKNSLPILLDTLRDRHLRASTPRSQVGQTGVALVPISRMSQVLAISAAESGLSLPSRPVLILDREQKHLFITKEALPIIQSVESSNPALLINWITSCLGSNPVASFRVAHHLQREITNGICTCAMPWQGGLTEIDPILGIHIRRCKDYSCLDHDIRALDASQKRNIGLIECLLKLHLGTTTTPTVSVGRFLDHPIIFREAQNSAVVDASVLSLGKRQITQLLELGFLHCRQAVQFQSLDSKRVGCAAFKEMIPRLTSLPRSAVMGRIKALNILKTFGWNVSAYRLYLSAIEEKIVAKDRKKPGSKKPQRLDFSRRLPGKRPAGRMRAKRKPHRFFGEIIELHNEGLSASRGERAASPVYCARNTRLVELSLASRMSPHEICHLARKSPCLEALLENSGDRTQYRRTTSLWRLMKPEEIRDRLAQSTGRVTSLKRQVQYDHVYASRIRRAAATTDMFCALLDFGSVERMITSLGISQRIELLGTACASTLPGCLVNPRGTWLTQDSTDGPGIRYLKNGDCSREALSFLASLWADLGRAAQTYSQRELQLAAAFLQGAVAKSWGIVLCLYNPTNGEDFRITDALSKIAPEVTATAREVVKDSELGKFPFVQEALLSGVVTKIIEPIPQIVSMAVGVVKQVAQSLTDKAHSGNLTPAISRMAMQVSLSHSSPSQQTDIAQALVPQLETSPGINHEVEAYAHKLAKATRHIPLNLALSRYYMERGEVPERETNRSLRDLWDNFPQNVRTDLLRRLFSDPKSFRRYVSSIQELAFKEYLLGIFPPDLLATHISSLEVNETRDLFSGVSPAMLAQLTNESVARHRQQDVLRREVYERFSSGYPEEIDNLTTGGFEPNHFAILGVPRTASPEQIRRSYRLLSIAYHPDRYMNEGQGSQDESAERIRRLSIAYAVLYDDVARLNFLKRIPNVAQYYPTRCWYQDLAQSPS